MAHRVNVGCVCHLFIVPHPYDGRCTGSLHKLSCPARHPPVSSPVHTTAICTRREGEGGVSRLALMDVRIDEHIHERLLCYLMLYLFFGDPV